MSSTFLTLQQFAQRYELSEKTALAIVRSGGIPAVNVATAGNKSGKARWRIRTSDLPAFEASRTNKPEPTPQVRTTKRKPDPSGTVFFRGGQLVQKPGHEGQQVNHKKCKRAR